MGLKVDSAGIAVKRQETNKIIIHDQEHRVQLGSRILTPGHSIGGTTLSLDIKKTEMATKDLVTVVKSSDLRSKNLLADALVAFIGDARDTGRGLQTLNARINSAVDRFVRASLEDSRAESL